MPEQQAKETHNFLVSILVFVRDSYLFCASCVCMLSCGESKSITNIIHVVKYENDEYFKL